MRAAAGIATIIALAFVAVASAATQPTGFRSPSGNISCLFVPSTRDDTGHLLPAQLLCSIERSAYGATLQNRCLNPNGQVGAGVDWHGFSLGATRRGSVVCTGGILYDPSLVKPSTISWTGPIAISSPFVDCLGKRRRGAGAPHHPLWMMARSAGGRRATPASSSVTS